MAVAYDTGGKSTVDITGTSGATGSITVANTAGRVMFAWLSVSGGDFTSTVKWNTTESFTQGVKLQNPSNEWLYLYYLVNPTATTSTVAATFSSSAGHAVILATCYNGANTPTQFSSTTYTGTSVTETLTVSANSWLVGGAGAQRQVSAGTGTTLRQQDAANNNSGLGDSGGALAAGSRSIVWTNASTTQVGLWCELPIAAASGPANLKSYDGNVKANVKSMNGNLIANVKSFDGNS